MKPIGLSTMRNMMASLSFPTVGIMTFKSKRQVRIIYCIFPFASRFNTFKDRVLIPFSNLLISSICRLYHTHYMSKLYHSAVKSVPSKWMGVSSDKCLYTVVSRYALSTVYKSSAKKQDMGRFHLFAQPGKISEDFPSL